MQDAKSEVIKRMLQFARIMRRGKDVPLAKEAAEIEQEFQKRLDKRTEELHTATNGKN